MQILAGFITSMVTSGAQIAGTAFGGKVVGTLTGYSMRALTKLSMLGVKRGSNINKARRAIRTSFLDAISESIEGDDDDCSESVIKLTDFITDMLYYDNFDEDLYGIIRGCVEAHNAWTSNGYLRFQIILSIIGDSRLKYTNQAISNYIHEEAIETIGKDIKDVETKDSFLQINF